MYSAHLAEYTAQCAVSDSAQVNAARSQDPVQAITARSQTIFFCLHLQGIWGPYVDFSK